MVDLLLSAGRGPRECCWALAHLLSRLETEAARRGLSVRRLRTVPGEQGGTFRSALIRISGDGAEAFAAAWTGTLCWQAASPYRATRRKNWYVIAQRCQVDSPRTEFSEADVELVAVRTGGPGGQHRNKASTAVRATHRPTGMVVVVDTERQLRLNQRTALRLLRERIEQYNADAARAVATTQWQIHDDLVRGNPTRTERPANHPGRHPGRHPARRRSRRRPGRAGRAGR